MSRYTPKTMLKNSRYIELSKEVDASFLSRWEEKIDFLIKDNKEYCDKKNYGFLCNLFCSLSYLMLKEEAGEDRNAVIQYLEKRTFRHLEKEKKHYQNFLRKRFAFSLIKKFVPKKMCSLSSHGWQIENGDSSKNSFTFYTKKCLVFELLKKYHYEELGPLFCHVDIFLYTGIGNTKFYRKETLAEKGSQCDFTFRWEKK